MANAVLNNSTNGRINSTNGRAQRRHVPPWFRSGFRVMGAMAPAAAATFGHRLLFTPRRLRPRDEERAVLARGQRFSFDVDRERIVARAWGEGPTVLLAHGWGGHSGQMTSLVDALVAAHFRAVAIDFPGHGESEGRLSSLVHFARAMARASAIFKPFHGIVAHSLGAAAVTYAFAHGGLQTSRAVFFAPPSDFHTWWGHFRTQVGVSDAIWHKIQRKAEGWLDVPFESIQPTQLAPHMSTPLLILHDVHDREVPIEQGEDLARRWPGATLQRAEHLGHVRILHDATLIQRAVSYLTEGAM
ncbi:lysophospholipase [Pendulispora rubella]|uniref:Lysophospholipase n=1 Tax=Pendulispora rubella TaxID=2741070 RepID=A0ABZ2L9L5_9BACT